MLPIKSMCVTLSHMSIAAGIGNIYSDEILYTAGIYPEEKCADLDFADWNRLARAIKEMIAWRIDTNEIISEEYLEDKGKEYRNMLQLRVYGREGQPLPTDDRKNRDWTQKHLLLSGLPEKENIIVV